MSWSDKLELLLQNFDLKTRIGPDGGGCKGFFICNQQVGIIRPDIWQHLSRYQHVFLLDSSTDSVTLNPEWKTYEERSAKMECLLQELRRHNIFTTLTGWREEVPQFSRTSVMSPKVREKYDAALEACAPLEGVTIVFCQWPSRAGNTGSEVKQRGSASVPGWGADVADAVGTVVRIPPKTCYEVSSRFGEPPLMKMERSATCLFGIKRYGVHINGYVTHHDGSASIWIQRRSSSKQTWPGKLDNLVSGGFSVGMTVQECVRKEAQEEASITDDLLDMIRPAGTVSFIFEDERGIFPEILFVFDLELPMDFTPENADNEVESFHLLSIEELKRLLVTDDFKTTSSLVTLDFMVRHGYLDPDNEPNYTQLIEMLHSPLHHLYP